MKNLISELGLRYRPKAEADLAAHAALLSLLARDVADVPPAYLAKAIDAWVREKPFMPKASELVALAKSFLPSAMARRESGMSLVEILNSERKRTDVEWYMDGETPRLRWAS